MEMHIALSLKRQPTPEEIDIATQKIATQLTALVKHKFDKSNPANWRPRMTPNIAGILEDLRKSANIEKRRFDAVPIGVDTGILRNTLTFDVVGKNELSLVVIDYAKQFHTGGKREIKIDGTIQKNFSVWWKKNKKKVQEPSLEYFFKALHVIINNRSVFSFTQSARPLLVEQDVKDIAQKVYERVVQ